MVYRGPEADTSRDSQDSARAHAEQNPLLTPRLTGSYSSQDKLPYEPLTQNVASNEDSIDEINIISSQDASLPGMSFYTQKDDDTLINEHDHLSSQTNPSNYTNPRDYINPRDYTDSSNHAESSSYSRRNQKDQQHKLKNPLKNAPRTPGRTLPYIKPRSIQRYPENLPSGDGEFIARLMQQHLRYLLPNLEDAYTEWGQANTEEAQEYWWNYIQSLQERVDHACQVMSHFLPSQEPTTQEPNLAAYVTLIQDYWRRPPQEKVVLVSPPRPPNHRPLHHSRDENVVVVEDE
ncbi:hypothetical protein BGZ49_009414 [Haplosporangium sp. Z 27]|nr:hypothetical protein BGZ49_009414 [Haplosporangium sp. Z 27]